MDDEVMHLYLENKEPDAVAIKRALRKGTVTGHFVPVLAGAAARNKGVQRVLDAVTDFLPSPADVPPVEGLNPKTSLYEKRAADEDAPLSALAFKIAVDPYVGRLTFFRVYSGKMKTGTGIYNSVRLRHERVGRLLEMHANKREERDVVYCGDIGAATGFKQVFTGDTLCEKNHPIVLEAMKFPEPVIAVAKSPTRRTRSVRGHEETVRRGPQGQGDEDTGRPSSRLKSFTWNHHRQNAEKPQLRQTSDGPGGLKGNHKEGGRGGRFINSQWTGTVRRRASRIEPRENRTEFEFDEDHRVIPRNYPGDREGRGARWRTASGRYSVTGIVTVLDGSYHEGFVGPSFKWQPRWPSRKRSRAEAKLLEPVMQVEVVVPEEYMGDVMADLSSRRGRIEGMAARPDGRVIDATVPLGEMFGYATRLRSLSQGRAIYTMEFARYDLVPEELSDKLISRIRG
jgi:elongation factor G